MKLKLGFFLRADERNSSGTWEYDFDVQSSNLSPLSFVFSGTIPGEYPDSVYVESSLENTNGEPTDGLYKLKLAYGADYEPITTKDGHFVVTEKRKDNNQVEEIRRLQLLRGADNGSLLLLLKRNAVTSESPFRELARFEIRVSLPEEKRKAMQDMVDELLRYDPSSALSELEGLSKVPIERRWTQGSSNRELWELATKCKELESLIKCLAPHLEWIRKNAASRVVKSCSRLPRNKVKKYSARTFRDLARFKDCGNAAHIETHGLVNSYDIPIHCAIKAFLVRLHQDVSGMVSRIASAEDKVTSDQGKEYSLKNQRDKWRIKELQEEIELLSDYKNRAKRLVEKSVAFLLDYYPWARCRGTSITTVSVHDIPNASAYTASYVIIQKYYKLRFFRESLLQGLLYVPEYIRREEDGIPSVWQRNYSAIYENWVFKHLVEAFSEASGGFRNLDTSFRAQLRNRVLNLCLGPTHNEPIHATTQTGDLQIDLFHGVVAYMSARQNKRSDPRPPFIAINNFKQTPDFAIVFSVPATPGKYHWLVLDAKSHQELKDCDIGKRNQYTNSIKYGKEPPDQSWLIYSGRLSKVPGIEFDSIDSNQLFDLRWKPASGIQNWETNKFHPVGHIRANVISLNGRRNPFLEFAEGQIATARRRLWLA